VATNALTHRLEQTALGLGADLFGIADLEGVRDFVADQGGPALAAFPRALSVGVVLPHAIVDQLPHRDQRQVAIDYLHHAYDVINLRLDQIASGLGSLLQRQGHRAHPVPASRTVDRERLCGAFSHKLAAHLAGLGWIGKSCLLVTPQHGPRVRWATVLTDAPVPATGTPLEPRCGDCDRCVAACPAQAFTGRTFAPEEPRALRFDARKCDEYFQSMIAIDPATAACGLCLHGCPHGQRASARLRARGLTAT